MESPPRRRHASMSVAGTSHQQPHSQQVLLNGRIVPHGNLAASTAANPYAMTPQRRSERATPPHSSQHHPSPPPLHMQISTSSNSSNGGGGGRRTPDIHSSRPHHTGAFSPPHPPTAPPPRDGRKKAQMNPLYHSQERRTPPMNSLGLNDTQHHQHPPPHSAAVSTPRGSVHSTIASARSAFPHAKLTLQASGSNGNNYNNNGNTNNNNSLNMTSNNSPSTHSTPVKSYGQRLSSYDSASGGSPLASPSSRTNNNNNNNNGATGRFQHIFETSPHQSSSSLLAQSDDSPASLAKKFGQNQYITQTALSWPSDHTNGGSSAPPHHNHARQRQAPRSAAPGLSRVMRNGVTSSSSSSSSTHYSPSIQPLSSPPFPSIKRNGAQMLDALLGSGSGGGSHHSNTTTPQHKPATPDEYEDVALMDLDEESSTSSSSTLPPHSSRPQLRPRQHSTMKKLDLTSAQGMRQPYGRKSFADTDRTGGNGGGGSGKGSNSTNKQQQQFPDVLPAYEWDLNDSDDESDHNHRTTHNHTPPTHNNTNHTSSNYYPSPPPSQPSPPFISVGMAEDANPRFRPTMEDAHVIKKVFGPNPVVNGGGLAATLTSSSNPHSSLGSFFAIYDGHGGRACVDFIGHSFHRELRRQLAVHHVNDVQQAIEMAALRTDAAMIMRPVSSQQQQHQDPLSFTSSSTSPFSLHHNLPPPQQQQPCEEYQECGSTACFAYIRVHPQTGKRELFVANIGDAQAVLAVEVPNSANTAANGNSKSSGLNDTTAKKKRKSSNNRASLNQTSSDAAAAASPSNARSQKKSRGGGGGVDPGINLNHSLLHIGGSNALGNTLHANASSSNNDSFAKTLPRSSTSTSASPPKYDALSLSYPHIASDAKEMQRIKAAGGCVFGNRVNGCLAVSRAFGDHSLKSAGVSCVPYQQRVELTPQHKYLLIGCDGVFDVMNAREAVEILVNAGTEDTQLLAQRVVDQAIKRGTTDNVSCLVVKLS